MKRLPLQIAAAAAIMTAITLAGCHSFSSNDSIQSAASSKSSETSASAVFSQESTPDSDSSIVSFDFHQQSQEKALEDYTNSNEFQSIMKTLKQAAASCGMKMDLWAEGNRLIYTYTFDDDIPTDGLAAVLDSLLVSQASTFEMIASTLKSSIHIQNPIVVVRYLDSNGNEMISREFIPT